MGIHTHTHTKNEMALFATQAEPDETGQWLFEQTALLGQKTPQYKGNAASYGSKQQGIMTYVPLEMWDGATQHLELKRLQEEGSYMDFLGQSPEEVLAGREKHRDRLRKVQFKPIARMSYDMIRRKTTLMAEIASKIASIDRVIQNVGFPVTGDTRVPALTKQKGILKALYDFVRRLNEHDDGLLTRSESKFRNDIVVEVDELVRLTTADITARAMTGNEQAAAGTVATAAHGPPGGPSGGPPGGPPGGPSGGPPGGSSSLTPASIVPPSRGRAPDTGQSGAALDVTPPAPGTPAPSQYGPTVTAAAVAHASDPNVFRTPAPSASRRLDLETPALNKAAATSAAAAASHAPPRSSFLDSAKRFLGMTPKTKDKRKVIGLTPDADRYVSPGGREMGVETRAQQEARRIAQAEAEARLRADDGGEGGAGEAGGEGDEEAGGEGAEEESADGDGIRRGRGRGSAHNKRRKVNEYIYVRGGRGRGTTNSNQLGTALAGLMNGNTSAALFKEAKQRIVLALKQGTITRAKAKRLVQWVLAKERESGGGKARTSGGGGGGGNSSIVGQAVTTQPPVNRPPPIPGRGNRVRVKRTVYY